MTSEPALDVSGQDDNSSIGAKEEDEDDDDDEDLREDRFVLLFVNFSVQVPVCPFTHLSFVYLSRLSICLAI